jgi:hypothetical protein
MLSPQPGNLLIKLKTRDVSPNSELGSPYAVSAVVHIASQIETPFIAMCTTEEEFRHPWLTKEEWIQQELEWFPCFQTYPLRKGMMLPNVQDLL